MADLYPQGTTELYKHLGAHPDHKMPVQAAPSQEIPPLEPEPFDKVFDHHEHLQDLAAWRNKTKAFIKTILPYAIVFIAAFLAWLIFFTNTPVKSFFSGLFNRQKPAATTQPAKPKISENQLKSYYQWFNSYFYFIADSKIADPEYDYSGNSLTNYEKYLLGLNPKKSDTIGLGTSDSEALLKGIDPLTGKPLTDQQKKKINSLIDLEVLANRISLAAARKEPKVQGANTQQPTSNYPTDSPPVIDTKKDGELNIPALNITVPVIWTKDVNNFDEDLKRGVSVYPHVFPGEIGTTYISGHSSNYAWSKGKYDQVFAQLDKLKKFDSFTIKAATSDRKTAIFHYVVTTSGIFKADDQNMFKSIGKPTAALSTCWPIGTNENRLVVFAEMTKIEIKDVRDK